MDCMISEEGELEEGHELMRIGNEQRSAGRRVAGAVDDRKNESFEPGGAGFGLGRENDVLVMSLEVGLDGDYVGNNFGRTPKTLVQGKGR